MNKQVLQQADQTSWQNNVDYLHLASHKAMARVRSHKLPLEYDDLFQEASVAYCYARKSFDASKGFKFITYLGNCVDRRIHKCVSTAMRKQIAMPLQSMEGMSHDDQESTMDIEDTGATPDELAQHSQEAARLLRKLSPMALLSFRVLHSTPPEIKAEYQAWRVKRGRVQQVALGKMTISTLFVCRYLMPRLYGITDSKARQLESEINYVVASGRWD